MTALHHIPAHVLRAAADRADTHQRRETLWGQLAEQHVDEALGHLDAGRVITVGWWRSHTPGRSRPDGVPAQPDLPRRGRWEPWELTAAAIDMAEEHIPVDRARDVLAQLAADHHLEPHHLSEAYTVLEHPTSSGKAA